MKIYNRIIATLCLFSLPFVASAQIGEHRNDMSIGFNGGYVLSNVGFVPKVTQGMHKGVTGGLSFRYTSEKYFKTICSIYAELNYAQVGWEENIVDMNEAPVINSFTGVAEKYKRTLSYVQMPVMAHLAWGKEKNGVQFFVNAGPQFGYLLGESTTSNFTLDNYNANDRTNSTVAQDTMSVEHKLDYGIAAGLGIEYSNKHVGHFIVEARYYYGLANMFGASKRDYFAKSNLGNIVVKFTYLFDVTRTK